MRYILLLLLIPNLCLSQVDTVADTKENRKMCSDLVKRFYEMLYYKESVTIREFVGVYTYGGTFSDDKLFIRDSLKIYDIDKTKHPLQETRKARDSDPSYIFKRLKPHLFELTNGLSYPELVKVIDKAELYSIISDGDYFMFEISLTESKHIYFKMFNYTEYGKHGILLHYIYLGNGFELKDFLHPHPIFFSYYFIPPLYFIGAINDKDGYSNVREKPFKDAKIVDRVTSDEIIYFIPNDSTNWWRVCRLKHNMPDVIGYIHKSRLIKYPFLPKKLKKKAEHIHGGC